MSIIRVDEQLIAKEQRLASGLLLARTRTRYTAVDMEHMSAGGNTEIPAYLALLREGFRVNRQTQGKDQEVWVAERHDLCISASTPTELLGLYAIRAQRGQNWRATDAEIKAFLGCFYPTDGHARST